MMIQSFNTTGSSGVFDDMMKTKIEHGTRVYANNDSTDVAVTVGYFNTIQAYAMKEIVIRTAALLLLLYLLPGMLLAAEKSVPDLYADSYYAQLKLLTDQLYGTQGKKIVLIGGSNIAFGTDVDLLEGLLTEKGYVYAVCPYGLYAAVGTGAMLLLAEDALGDGDLVILAMEPMGEATAFSFLLCVQVYASVFRGNQFIMAIQRGKKIVK